MLQTERTIDRSNVHLSHIMWDIDEPFLPRELDVTVKDVLEPGESLKNVSYNDIIDRIADFVLEKYGFDVQGFNVDVANKP